MATMPMLVLSWTRLPVTVAPETLMQWVLAEVNPNPVDRYEEIGTDEVQLIPTSSDLDQVRRAADVAAQF